MKVSLNWLRELVALPAAIDAAAAAEVLTRQGLEVEGIEARGRDVAGVVVAEVVAVRPHPGADKLRLVRVRAAAGAGEEEVVCGASNVPAPGGRVCWARPGARLPGGVPLAVREIRGVRSPGMLASEKELGITPAADGIVVLPEGAALGADVAAVLGLRDDVLEVNVTPNRPDALSHLGIARELAAGLAVALTPPPATAAPFPGAGGPDPGEDDGRGGGPRGGTAPDAVTVSIADADACPRYVAHVVTGLRVAPSPLAMRVRLAACGMRSISNLVDVTNYVLLETGHPLHAFDLDKIEGPIVVRRAAAGEPIATLDGQPRVLAAEDIVIADARGPVAIAGVMGGAASEVGPTTTRVLLEAATFDPRSIRRTARRLGLLSEASYRFERGVDAAGVPLAGRRAAALLAALGGGEVAGQAIDCHPRPARARSLKLTTARLRRVSGRDLDAAGAADKLRRLGIACAVEADGVLADVPTWRRDLVIEEDLIEEVLRLGEYERAPAPLRARSNAISVPSPEAPADRARDLLAGAGLCEIVSWGFVPRAALDVLGDGSGAIAHGILVRNPLSADYEAMRTSLLPGLAAALARNLARGFGDVGLFEVGPVIQRIPTPGPPLEQTYAAGILCGRAPGWLKPGEALDFFDARALVEELLAGLGARSVEMSAAATRRLVFLHPGMRAAIRTSPGGGAVGAVGEIHPKVARHFGIEARAYYFDVCLDEVLHAREPVRAKTPPRFPAVARDVSFWIDESVPADEQRAAFLAASEALLVDLAVREDFRDPRHVAAGKKGMLWTMTYRAPDRTLVDAEADAAHARVVAALSSRIAIQIR